MKTFLTDEHANMALVDPFIPQPPSGNEQHSKIPPGYGSLKRPRAQTTPDSSTRQQPRGSYRKTFMVPERRIGRAKLAVQMTAILVLSVVLGLAASNQSIGAIAIAIYAVIALVARFGSGTSFALAVLAFFMLMTMEITRPTNNLSANFAVYAFLLLVVGTVSLWVEVRQEAKWEKRKKRSK